MYQNPAEFAQEHMSARESNPSLCGTKTNLESAASGVVVIDKKLARLLITPQELILRNILSSVEDGKRK